MKVEFFPAAEQELTEASEHYEAQLQGLGNDFLLEVERLSAVLIELPSLGEKLDSSIVGFLCNGSRTHSSSAAMRPSFALSPLRIVGASHGTGRREFKSANKCLVPTRGNPRAAQAWALGCIIEASYE